MWVYKKYLEYPVCITKPNLDFAINLITAIGGSSGEVISGLRYFMQASSMPDNVGRNLLYEIATEEMSHVEIVYAMINQLTRGLSVEDYKKLEKAKGMYADHGMGIYPTDANGYIFKADYFSSLGDALADLSDDMAAEQKARASYEHLMDLTDDPEILGPLSFLRQREIIHYERFKEAFLYYSNLKNNCNICK